MNKNYIHAINKSTLSKNDINVAKIGGIIFECVECTGRTRGCPNIIRYLSSGHKTSGNKGVDRVYSSILLPITGLSFTKE